MKNQLRNPILSGAFSALLPGTGQIYNQEIIKGWIILIAFLLLAGTIIGSVGVWGYGVVDAYLTAGKINKGQKKIRLERNSLLAAISSLICGWGQIYNGQTVKGGLMMLSCIFLAPTGIGAIIMLLYGAVDAYFTSEKINRGELETPLISGLIYHRLDELHVFLEAEDNQIPSPKIIPSITGLKQKVNFALQRNDYHGAILYGTQAVHGGGAGDTEIHRQLGKAYIYTGNYGFSTLEFIHAIEEGDRSTEVCNNLAGSILS